MKKLFPSNSVYIAKSKIPKAGRGVFASRNIKKNEIIEKCPILEVPKSDRSNLAESILVTYFFFFGKKKERMALALGFGSVYNHSYKPNATFKIRAKNEIIEFVALKEIRKDTEVTFNYYHGTPKGKSPLWFEAYYVYILLCQDGSLYTGSTNDVEKRFKDHLEGRGARYTVSHKPKEIVYSEEFSSKSEALKREAEIKKLSKAEKAELISSR